jgi:hypothetical protein
MPYEVRVDGMPIQRWLTWKVEDADPSKALCCAQAADEQLGEGSQVLLDPVSKHARKKVPGLPTS